MAPTDTELASAITGVLTACRTFRRLYGQASPEQQATIMAGFPWPKRALELREMTAWARITVMALTPDEKPARLAAVTRRAC